MKKLLPVVAATALFAATHAIAQDAPAVVVTDSYSAQAEVVAVDYTKRTATLKTDDGITETIHIGAEVKNFGQLKKGDKVLAKYSQALMVSLKKKGSPAYVQRRTDGITAEPGQKPAAAGMHEITFAADIIKLDAKTGALTVKGPKGRVVDLKVQDPKVLQGYTVGDQVEGTFLEVVALGAVTPAAPATAAPAAPAPSKPAATK